MAAIIQSGISGLSFGVKPETGVVVMSVTRNATSGSKECPNEQGDIIAHAAYGFKAEYTVTCHTTGVTGLAGVSIGGVFALANASNYNGISGGTHVVKGANLTSSNEDFQQMTINITQYPAI